MDKATNGAITIEGTDRARLVRQCLRFCGDPQVAEDLTQETLIEAWRNQHKLYSADSEGQAKWLSRIAHHVCQRWSRRKARDSARLSELDLEQTDLPSPEPDLEFDLERDELANLLDRAMALLPPETRSVLVARYLEDAPQTQVAERFNMSESAVAVRLHRGKLALRRTLAAELQPNANPEGWQETRIWCPQCGKRQLLGRLSNDELVLHCTNCCTDPAWDFMYHVDRTGKLAGIKNFKSALSRVMKWANTYYRQGLIDGTVRCMACSANVPLRIGSPPYMPLQNDPGVYATCTCDGTRPDARNHSSLWGLANFLPEVQEFWRRNPRMRMVPQYDVEASGRPAFVFTFENITSSAHVSVVFARDNYDLLSIHGNPTK